MAELKTRYRDVEWSEIARIHVPSGMCNDSLDWNSMRGKEITIRIPALPDTDYCGGPWFRIIEGPTTAAFACPHLAEIGD